MLDSLHVFFIFFFYLKNHFSASTHSVLILRMVQQIEPVKSSIYGYVYNECNIEIHF